MKRLIDIFGSLVGLIVFFLPLLIFVIVIKLNSPGPIFYRGLRAGKNEKEFHIFKFRSMVMNADKIGGPSTSGDDSRLTSVGKFMRKYKIDELPQLLNVLRGEMSLVGPRPEVVSEVATYPAEVRAKILSVKPGMTDWASLWNIHEEEILAGATDPHRAYREKIQPTKLKLQLQYVDNHSLGTDIIIIVKTIIQIFIK